MEKNIIRIPILPCVYNYEKYKHKCTWYIHDTYMKRYKRICTLFRRVCTCILKYIHVLTYKHGYVCQSLSSWYTVNRWLHTFHKKYRNHWIVYIHCCILLVAAFLFAQLAVSSWSSNLCLTTLDESIHILLSSNWQNIHLKCI